MTSSGPGQGETSGSSEPAEPSAASPELPTEGDLTSDSPVPPDAPTQRTGVVSAAPVGWSAGQPPAAPPPSAASTDQPVVAWAPPAAPAARSAVGEGLVIAGVFSRLVAFVIDAFILGCISIAIGVVVGAYREGSTAALALGVGLVGVAIEGLYFVALWTSGWRGTLGM